MKLLDTIKQERNHGIDLLRPVLMFMVCILHTLGQGGVLRASIVGSMGYKAFWFLEILCYCAVDGFAIISGYTATNKPRKYERIVDMWFQAFFYSFILTLILTIAGVNKNPEQSAILECALPITYNKFWYFSAYFVLFFSIPILNSFLFAIDEKTAKKAFVILIVLFSIIGLYKDPFGAQEGYSAIWLIVLYCVGVLAKRIKLFETRNSLTLTLLWFLCILITWVVYVFAGCDLLISYVSPTILLSGIILVVLFSRIHFKAMFMDKLYPLAFGIYLFQSNPVIWNNVIKGACAFVAAENVAMGFLYVFAFAFLIFISGLAVEFVRSVLAKLLRIPALSKKIVELVDKCFTKICG